ncbi:MAG: PAS domain-containing protein [Nitrospira sp.]|nr:PAS domain-containing protein [Nitrospira sp.]
MAFTTAPIIQDRGTLSGTVIACRDITLRKENEREQEQTRAFLQSVFDNIPHMITVRDADDLQFIQINKAGEDLLGRSSDQLLGKNLSECFPAEQAAILTAKDQEVIRDNRRIDLPDDQLLSPRYGLRRMHTIKIPIGNRHGHPEFLMSISQDMTERTEAENALQSSQQLLDQIMNCAGEGIISLDHNGRIEFANAAALAILGYDLHELIGADLHDLTYYASEDGSPYSRQNSPIYQALTQGHTAHCDTDVFWRKNTTSVPIEYLSTPKRNEQGDVTGIVLTFRDITARKETDQKLLAASTALSAQNAILAEARDQAMLSAKAKSEFLVSVSHELRTPMNAIIGMTELLNEVVLPDTARNHVARLSRASTELLNLIDNILDITNADRDKLTLRIQPFDLHGLIKGTSIASTARAQAKGLDLITIADPALPALVQGDRERLQKILVCLLDNAVKFTHRGSVIFTVSTETADHASGKIHFSISDTGIGIPEDKLTHIFETFIQVDSSNTRRYGGTGLGLSLVQRLVELMGGKIHVESTVGHGSDFSFSIHLPASDQPAPSTDQYSAATKAPGPESGDESTRVCLKDAQQRLTPAGTAAAPDGGETRHGRVSVRPLHILVADDLEDNRDVVKLFLKDMPYVLDEVDNGALAVDRFKTDRYDLVLMDMQMPVMDGYTATRTIRAWEQAEQRVPTPIIALTADALHGDRQKGLDCGCSAYLTKPARKKLLLDTIQRYTNNGCGHAAIGS